MGSEHGHTVVLCQFKFKLLIRKLADFSSNTIRWNRAFPAIRGIPSRDLKEPQEFKLNLMKGRV